jgi:hypothetical protein
MAIVEKFKRGDRVTINPEAVEGLEHLFPKGFHTFNGTVRSSRIDWHYDPYPERKDRYYVYGVVMDQDSSVTNISFVEEDMTLLLSADIVALDNVIKHSEANLEALKTIRNTMAAAYREKD